MLWQIGRSVTPNALIVVEHNLQMMKAANYLIDLGPDADDEGGKVVIKDTPEMVANCPNSVTGRFLAEVLRESLQEESASGLR